MTKLMMAHNELSKAVSNWKKGGKRRSFGAYPKYLKEAMQAFEDVKYSSSMEDLLNWVDETNSAIDADVYDYLA